MELQKLISEKKKSGIGNKRESVDLTGGNFGEGQPSCYRSIKQPSFGLFFAIFVGWENQTRLTYNCAHLRSTKERLTI